MLTFAYARWEILGTLLLGAAVTVVVEHYYGWWALVPAILALTLLAFYRDPPRRTPVGDDFLMAPADGIIVDIDRNRGDPDGGRPRLRIMTFLRVSDVHVNRSPCAARVSDVQYRPGKFINAMRAEASECNECNTITLEPAAPLPGPVRVRQIAGILARRIVCAVRPGDELLGGQHVGMIKLGSRTELSVPEHPGWYVAVRVGEKVYAGQTVLLRLRPMDGPVEVGREDHL